MTGPGGAGEMFRCDRNHEPILHEGWDCPLCAALDEVEELHRGLDGAAHQIAGMAEVAEECGDADVLQLIAENEAQSKRLWAAESAFSSLDRVINHPWEKTLGKRLLAIQKAYGEAGGRIRR